jgi:hypothetical protein
LTAMTAECYFHDATIITTPTKNNKTLIRLPLYSPELNPAEQIWNTPRRNYFANRVFDALNAATTQAEFGLAEMAANKLATRQLTNWPWISAILKM